MVTYSMLNNLELNCIPFHFSQIEDFIKKVSVLSLKIIEDSQNKIWFPVFEGVLDGIVCSFILIKEKVSFSKVKFKNIRSWKNVDFLLSFLRRNLNQLTELNCFFLFERTIFLNSM